MTQQVQSPHKLPLTISILESQRDILKASIFHLAHKGTARLELQLVSLYEVSKLVMTRDTVIDISSRYLLQLRNLCRLAILSRSKNKRAAACKLALIRNVFLALPIAFQLTAHLLDEI